MAIEFRTSRGRRLPWLYGRFYIKNHSHVVNTGVRWRGIPPVSLLDSGDTAFEESRAAAKIALSAIAARRRQSSAPIPVSPATLPVSPATLPVSPATLPVAAAKPPVVLRAACGEHPPACGEPSPACGEHPLSPAHPSSPAAPSRPALAAILLPASPRSRSASWLEWRRSVLSRFIAWAAANGIADISKIDRVYAEAYIAEISAPDSYGRIRTARTLRAMRGVIATTIDRLLAPGQPNPFRLVRIEALPGDHTINRRPLSEHEVTALLRAAETFDPAIHDLILAALCTGLRRGDVCRLRWDSVRLRENVLRVTTSKTGASLELPILPALRKLLSRLRDAREKGQAFVFPAAERLLRTNPDQITLRVKKAFAIAFATPGGSDPSVLSGHMKKAIDSVTRQRRAIGVNRASTYDFHALRTTFVTLAINGGIPVDKLRALTGHRTVDMVLRHYYKPKGSDLAADLRRAMPAILSKP